MNLRRILLLTTALVPLGIVPAAAGPDGPNVVGGAATVVNPGSPNVTVNQHTDKAIINWRLFDVGAGERVQFNQPNSGSVILNRVTGGLGPSQIFGTIDANGRVFVVNRDGILFGPNAQINTAGFLATTSDIKNEDFMAGRYKFDTPGRPDASIVNLGTITAANGGFAALVAPGVRNTGTITATMGNVTLAAGNTFSANLDFYGDRLISLNVGDTIASSVRDVATGLPLKALVTNDGKIKADGGRVELSAVAARQVVDAVINTSGVIEANTVGTKNGMIVLGAATEKAKPAGAPTQTVKLSGTIKAAAKEKGTKGGTVQVTGETIQVAAATIDVSGPAGGGKVLIGGDWGGGKPDASIVSHPGAKLEAAAIPTATTVTVDAATRIDASATERGDGGKVILWADGHLSFTGTILAMGGASFGDGGFVEVSGKRTLDFLGLVDTRGPHGKTGTLLLDPETIVIWNGDGEVPVGATLMLNTTIQTQLATNNVTIATNNALSGSGDIYVNAPIVWNSATTLTLSAYRSITVGYNPDGSMIQNTGAGNLVLRADSTGTGTGTVQLISDGHAALDWSQSSGKVTIYYNPDAIPLDEGPGTPKYANPNNYHWDFDGGSNQLIAYMLVNNVADLSAIATNLSGTYALGKDITDFSSVPNFAPIGSVSSPFTGIFVGTRPDGGRYTISGLTIAPSGAAENAGLFGRIGPTGIVRDLNIDNASITTAGVTSWTSGDVGILAGSNAGLIEHVTVSGSITTGNTPSVTVSGAFGGLVGTNDYSGMIAHAHAHVALQSHGPSSGYIDMGGLVGVNSGQILDSHAHGNVTSTHSSFSGTYLGGLVGWNIGGSILLSTAAGSVTGDGANGFGGGLIGVNAGGTVGQSHATGAVQIEGPNSFAGGLIGTNYGPVNLSYSTGDVSGTALVSGGLIGLNTGFVQDSYSTSNVTAADLGIAGALIGLNTGTVTKTFASGATTGGAGSFLAGLVAINGGTIAQSYALGPVTGNANSFLGGLAALNLGSIDQTYAAGLVTGGPGSTMGGLIAVAGVPSGVDPGSLGPVPTLPNLTGTTTNSYWDTTTTGQNTSAGGTPQTSTQLASGTAPGGYDPGVWTTNAGYYPCVGAGCTPAPQPGPSANPNPPVDPNPPVNPDPPQQPHDPHVDDKVVSPQLTQTSQLTKEQDIAKTPEVVTPPATTPTNPPSNTPPSNNGRATGPLPSGNARQFWFGPNAQLGSGMPPLNETRFAGDEVMLQLRSDVTPEQIAALSRQLGLEVIATQTIDLLGRTIYRFKITSGMNVRDVIAALQRNEIAAQASPSYTFQLAQTLAQQKPASETSSPGNSAQYIVAKWKLAEVHRLVRGIDVKVAVIDSSIDPDHPELAGVILERFDATGSEDRPHPHGTGMAGAIASHGQVLGVAPGAKLLAVRAFGPTTGGAQGTSMAIVKGIEWAVKQGAQVINMSFAGPRDPLLEQAIKGLREKGIVVIAAAGNAGPKSPVLFPGGDPNVIAVTATDVEDKTYVNANRGKHIAVAAPGVDILVPAPEGGYQLTTGTSVAAAHVSGVAALILERNPGLKPDQMKRLLMTTATNIKARPEDVSSGLIDPLKAVTRADPKSAGTQ